MDCPNNCGTKLGGVNAYDSTTQNNIRGASRYHSIDYLYCGKCKEVFKLKLESLDSKPKLKVK